MEIVGGAGGTCTDAEVLFPVARVVRMELNLGAWEESFACKFLCVYILLWLIVVLSVPETDLETMEAASCDWNSVRIKGGC